MMDMMDIMSKKARMISFEFMNFIGPLPCGHLTNLRKHIKIMLCYTKLLMVTRKFGHDFGQT